MALLMVMLVSLLTYIFLPSFRGNISSYSEGPVIYDSNGVLLRSCLGGDETMCRPVHLKQMGDWAVKAAVACEDKRFFSHCGVDGLAIARAFVQNLTHMRRISGASTLSTLVVKLTDPRPRTLLTKLTEAKHAIALEAGLTKDQLLEQFLNRAPFGGNIKGIESASWYYFGKHATDLTLAETALLVGLPQSPTRLRPDRNPAGAKARMLVVLERMKKCGFITETQSAIAAKQDIVFQWERYPFLAPHFCDYAISKWPAGKQINLTLDMRFQEMAQRVLTRRIREMNDPVAANGAIVIIRVKDCHVLAMVGSPSYSDNDNAGQFNAALGKRSPGSTLKPFVYAAAFDQGLMTPETVIADRPRAYMGYNPRNYDKTWNGDVSVRQALVQSLNIPAIVAAEKLGLEKTVSVLRKSGINSLDKNAGYYGLSVTIGTCETTLIELCSAYACLARGGIYKEPIFRTDISQANDRKVFSEEAAYMISDILSGEERAIEATGSAVDAELPRIAWKTGTSSGNRDAWTIAYNPEYVIGVWVGNHEGRPSAALVGGKAATPAAIDIFRQLYPKAQTASWFKRPAGLKARHVCAKSGCVANERCTSTILDDYIPNISVPAVCNQHKETGSQPVQAVFASAQPRSKPVRILYPCNGEKYRYIEDSPMRQEISLRAEAESSDPLYWFVDGKLLASASIGKNTWGLARGKHSIICSDSIGNHDSVTVEVE